jgi:hypothetical protein
LQNRWVIGVVASIFLLNWCGCYQDEFNRYDLWQSSARGEFHVELNGEPWQGNCWAARSHRDNTYIGFEFSDRNRYYQTYFSFVVVCPIPFEVGEYYLDTIFCPIVPFTYNISLHIIEVDAIASRYRLIEAEGMPNKLIIEDIRGNWFRGKFQLAFEQVPSGFPTDDEFPRQLIFRDGSYVSQLLVPN